MQRSLAFVLVLVVISGCDSDGGGSGGGAPGTAGPGIRGAPMPAPNPGCVTGCGKRPDRLGMATSFWPMTTESPGLMITLVTR